MRSYQCHFHAVYNGKKQKSAFYACWGGIAATCFFTGKNSYVADYPFKNQDIWIEQWKQPETEKFAPLLVSIINQITPCEIEGEFIKIRLLDTYKRSLLLLNFVRNLWNEPLPTYAAAFFKALQETEEIDPLAKLTYANKVACGEWKSIYPPGHSNVCPPASLKIRMKADLFKEDIITTEKFLMAA